MLTLKRTLFSLALVAGTLSAQTYSILSSGKLAGSTGSAMALYDVYEIAARRTGGSNYSNAWTDASVTATFTDPSNNTHVFKGFLYSCNGTFAYGCASSPYEYHVRFAPTKAWGTGTYSWTLTWDSNTVGSGTFTVMPGSNTGFVRQHATNPYSLITENDGKFFFATGSPEQQGFAYTPGSVARWTLPVGDNGSYSIGNSSDLYFSTYGNNGGTLYRMNGEQALELTQPNYGGSGKFITNLDQGPALDDTLIHARNYDVHVMWTPIVTPLNFTSNYDLSDSQLRAAYFGYWDYVIARYGPFVDLWEYYNEDSGHGITSPTPAAFQSYTSNHLIASDPYGHLRSPGGSEYANASQGTNLTAAHHYWASRYSTLDDDIVNSPAGNGAAVASAKAIAPNIPMIFGESGNGGAALSNDCRDQTRYRTMVYTTLFNQSSGWSFWDNSVWGGGCDGSSGLANFYFGQTTRKYATAVKGFISSYWDATATPKTVAAVDPANTRAYAMGNGTSFLAVYMRTLNSSTTTISGQPVTLGGSIIGKQFTVTVPTAGMTARWISLVDGSTVGSTFTPSTGSQTFTVPTIANDPWNNAPPPDVVLVMSTTTVSIASPCDLNSDGVVNNIDVKLAIDQALGVSTCQSAILGTGGSCTVVGVQRVINAVLGGTCRVGP
jgi:hypothetical protein